MDTNTDIEQDAVPLAENALPFTGSINTPEENSSHEKEFVRKYFEELTPELKVGYYDIVFLYDTEDLKEVDECRKFLCKIELKNGSKLKAVLHDDPDFMSLSGAEFENLEQVFERCTFAFVFLSKTFVKNKWCKIISESFMVRMLNDPDKMWSVVPVLTSQRRKLDFEIPLGLNALRELKFYDPIDYFTRCVKALVSGRYNVRAKKEKILFSRRVAFLSSKFPKSKGDSSTNIDTTSACNIGITNGQGSLTDNLQNLNLHGNRQPPPVDDLETDSPTCCKKKHMSSESNNLCQSNFLKKIDDKDLVRNNRLVANASHSVGIIKGPYSSGTGFRVGTKYLATARHVILENTERNGDIDKDRLRSSRLFVEFEYISVNQQHTESNIFFFSTVSYENIDLDTIILELKRDGGKTFPPPISLISNLNRDRNMYIIGHPSGLPQMVDPKIKFYQYNKDDVDKSKAWAASQGIPTNDYRDIDNKDMVLFHCASQHGASGALGVMIDQSIDEPQSVVMLLRGFPNFYYGNQSFTESDKDNFLIVEQGVLLSSVYEDMKTQQKYNEIVKDIIGTLQNPTED